jgi:hypothetical protein
VKQEGIDRSHTAACKQRRQARGTAILGPCMPSLPAGRPFGDPLVRASRRQALLNRAERKRRLWLWAMRILQHENDRHKALAERARNRWQLTCDMRNEAANGATAAPHLTCG